MSFCQDVKQEVMKTPLREFHCRNAMVYAILKLSNLPAGTGRLLHRK